MDNKVSLVEVFNVEQNVCLIKSFLDKNYPIEIDWDNKNIVFLLLLYTGTTVVNKIIGLAVFTPYDKSNLKYHMNALYITHEWRNKKFGTHMLTYAKQRFKNVTFSVMFKDNHLLQFYSKFAALDKVCIESGIYVFNM